MVINGISLLRLAPIKDMVVGKFKDHGVSWGLSEVGYDIRVKQTLEFYPPNPWNAFNFWKDQFSFKSSDFKQAFERAFFGYTVVTDTEAGTRIITTGRTVLASSIECFQIPKTLWCEFRNKSTHARRFCDFTIGTDGEPDWGGYLTIEGIFHANKKVIIPAGSGILKAVFHEIKHPVSYDGKYQNQEDRPVEAILA